MSSQRTMTPRRLKANLLLSGAGLSGIILLSWTQEWFVIVLDDAIAVSVAGDVAAQGLSALALAGLVLIGALSIAGRVFRVILGILQSLIGVTVAFSAFLAVSDPIAASATAITQITGVAGTASVAALVQQIEPSAWGWVALCAGIALMVHGGVVVAVAHRWPASSKKYQSTAATSASVAGATEGAEPSAVDHWDALTKGDDPT
jgi:hypothetical protein